MDRRAMLGSGLAAAALGAAASAGAARARPAARRGPAAGVRTDDATKLFVRAWGEGPPVLFVHSWALSSEMWDRQFAALGEQGLRCIAFDRRGHGRSDVPSSGYDMDTLADDLAAVIAAQCLRDITLVGHSMGGNEVVRYLGRHGTARVRRVVLLAPTTPFVLQTADNPYGAPPAFFEATRAQWIADFPKWVEDNKRPFFTPETSAATMEWLAGLMLATPLPVALACNRSAVATDLRTDLARIDRPVLVLQGDKDASAPLDITGRRTAAGIPGAQLKVYPGAPHGLFVTHAAQVNADLIAFARG